MARYLAKASAPDVVIHAGRALITATTGAIASQVSSGFTITKGSNAGEYLVTLTNTANAILAASATIGRDSYGAQVLNATIGTVSATAGTVQVSIVATASGTLTTPASDMHLDVIVVARKGATVR